MRTAEPNSDYRSSEAVAGVLGVRAVIIIAAIVPLVP